MKKVKTTVSDPFYSKVLADTGTVVSGGAALLVRAKAMGGPTNMIEAAVRFALDQSNAAVHEQRRGRIRAVR